MWSREGDLSQEQRADADRRLEAEHRATFPDRRCVVGSGCAGIVIVTFGGAQLCTGHATEFRDADHETTVDRLRAWVREKRRAKP